MAVSELCIVGKPVVFVPFPFAAEDHQTANAKKLVDQNAALMISDKDASKSLVQTIISLSKDENRQAILMKNIQALSLLNADEIVAVEILKCL